METTPTVDTVIDFFDAQTVELGLDVKDRVAASIVDVRSPEGSTVRFYNAAEEEFMKVRADRVSKLYQPLFDETLVGVRHAEDGRLYAILKGDDGMHEEPVGVLPVQIVQVGPDCEFGRRISAVAVEYTQMTVTVSLMAPFAELVTATRPYTEGEADELL